jgi:hypothetical protein
MNESDRKIRREILKYIYDKFEESVLNRAGTEDLYEQLEEVDQTEIHYNLVRLRDERQIDFDISTGGVHSLEITAEGIEKLDQDGYETVLEDEVRYDILQLLYETDRERPFRSIKLSSEDIAEELDIEEDRVLPAIGYLDLKELVDAAVGSRPEATYRGVEITGRGRNKYELYVEEGTSIPNTQPLTQWTQHSVGPNEEEKAENLFQSVVEVAQEKITIVDWYFKEPAYDLLEDVPDAVDIEILTSGRAFDDEDEYRDLVADFAEDRSGEVDVRYVEYYDFEARLFHARYLVRDEIEGWTWDQSFKDAGETQHTVSEVRPVNLESTMETFQEAWEQGEQVNGQ